MNIKSDDALKAAEAIKAICKECQNKLSEQQRFLPTQDVQRLSDHAELTRQIRRIQVNTILRQKKQGIVDWDISETLLLSSDTDYCLNVNMAFGQIRAMSGLVENQLAHDEAS